MAQGSVGRGWNLVWRHGRILWWVFGINLVLGFLATVTPRVEFGAILDRSLNSQKLVNGLDVGSFVELISKPEIDMAALMRGSIVFTYLFFLFMLFVTGGILAAYREDRHLSTGEFFESSGRYFWRMLRLFLMSIVPFVVIAAIVGLLYGAGSSAASEVTTWYLHIIVAILGLILVLLVRLWFDVAQVRAVAQNEHGMFYNLRRAFTITRGALGSLLWIYLRISIVGWLLLAIGLWLWTKISGPHFFLSWLLLELVMLTQIFTRLWQRAASVSWYGFYAEEHPAAAVEFTTPAPQPIVEEPRVEEPPPTEPLPPAEPV